MRPVIIALLVSTAACFAQPYPFVFKPLAGTLETGNGGPAASALLKTPSAVVAEPGGGFLVLDSDHYQVRRVSPDGTIAPVLALNFPCNDMKLGRDGTLYFTTAGLVFKVPRTGPAALVAGRAGGDNPQFHAEEANTTGLALDANGGVYFVDGHRVRYAAAGGTVRNVAGTGTAGYNGDNRPAAEAQLNYPWGLALDGAGNLYIADRLNSRVRKVSPAGTITTVAGTGVYGVPVTGSATSPIGHPRGVAVDGRGNLFVTDVGTGSVVRIDGVTGVLTRLNGVSDFNFDDGPAAGAFVHEPGGIALDESGSVLFTELSTHRVRLIRGSTIATVAGRVRYDGDGDRATGSVLAAPHAVAVDSEGGVLIADNQGYRIRRATRDGIIVTLAGNGSRGTPLSGSQPLAAAIPAPTAIAADARGGVYFAAGSLVYRIADGVVTTFAGTGAAGDSGDGLAATRATFRAISGLAVDTAGNVYIGDHGSHRVRRVDTAGRVSAFAGTGTAGFAGDNGQARAAQLRGQFAMPLAFDPQGSLYIGDSGNYRVRMVSPAGVITTLAGNGTQGITEDGARAAAAALDHFSGLAADANGVFVALENDRSIYRVEAGLLRRVSGGSVGAPAADLNAIHTRGFDARGLALDENGDLISADRGAGVVWKLMRNTPTDLLAASGDDQSARARSQLRQELKVLVGGRAEVGVEGVPVRFTVESGAATLAAETVMTDSKGIAATSVMLGGPGQVRIRATVAGLPEVIFTAMAMAPTLSVAPESITFRWTRGTVPPDPVTLAVGEEGVAFTASVEEGAGWLEAEVEGGGVKVRVVNVEDAKPGTYRGAVTIQAPEAEPASITVPVEWIVE